jgi:hypothetical protein
VSAFVRYTIALLLAYFLTWTASYTYTVFNAVGHLDFATYFPNYFLWFIWAVSGPVGDMAAGTMILSFILLLPFAIVAVFLARTFRRTGA